MPYRVCPVVFGECQLIVGEFRTKNKNEKLKRGYLATSRQKETIAGMVL